MPRYLVSAGLWILGVTLVLTALSATPSTAVAQKGKAPPPPPPPTPKKPGPDPFRRPPTPFPGTRFGPYTPHGPMGLTGLRGLSAVAGMRGLPGFMASRCPTNFGAAPLGGQTQCAVCHRDWFNGPGGLGRPGRGADLPWMPEMIAGDPVQWMIAQAISGGAITPAGLRNHLLISHGLDPDVMALVSGRHQALRSPLGGLNQFFMMDDPLGPWAGNLLGGIDPFGRANPFGLRPAPFHDVFGGLGAFDITLTRPGGYRPLALPPTALDLMWPRAHSGIDIFDIDGFGGLYPPFGGGMFGRPAGMGLPGMRGFGPIGGGFDPWNRIGRLPPPRPRAVPQAPSRDEQRTALEKFDKALAGVETLARAGVWDALGTGLEKTGSGLPGAVAAPLKGIQAEAARLDELLRLRTAVTTTWAAAPDPAALAKHVEALRTATGDAKLADRLTRLLAVKALWEGHDATAVRLCGAEAPNLDAELEALRRPHLADPERAAPIATDEDRDAVCQRVVRELLGEIDHHLDCGRYSASVHLADVRAVRTGVSKALKTLTGADPKPADTFEAVAAEVSKALGRKLTETDRVILRQMHAAKKSLEEMTAAVR